MYIYIPVCKCIYCLLPLPTYYITCFTITILISKTRVDVQRWLRSRVIDKRSHALQHPGIPRTDTPPVRATYKTSNIAFIYAFSFVVNQFDRALSAPAINHARPHRPPTLYSASPTVYVAQWPRLGIAQYEHIIPAYTYTCSR